ncbi:RNA polymerase sigma-I factor [Anaerobacillus alkaliphilus]|uniref:RNA polymerase sigma factor SigI n=1 Tax=Anaerobacillus alkaliphilus TaxID=1548597 RepID=A0A4Q0VUX5_9BACI|nr:RNA polymerase sigma-I factor [Anaerobacillus alkaliphilus]RXJ01775.1 RNA polymerase sigma-I factor [Anaerobacillus alkaliphilus]
METANVVEDTASAQNGDQFVREKLIRHYKPYVLNTVGHICKKYISWSEEEASIGLIALNKAIDTYDSSKGRTFLNYVYLLVQRDLIDFFRKEKNERHVSLNANVIDEGNLQTNYEVEQSLQRYEKEKQANDLVEEILELSEELEKYQINFEELEKFSPKHKDTRESLFELVERFVEDQECVEQFIKKRQFPTTMFVKKTGYKVKTIERHRKYIVTLILLKLHPQWILLGQYIQRGDRS